MLPNTRQLVQRRPRPHPRRPEVPDLHSQLEGLLDQVWNCEAEWRFDDRLDLALRRMPRAPRRGRDLGAL